jgi:peptidoglycan/LPS O-acetylase OafA/YrhL
MNQRPNMNQQPKSAPAHLDFIDGIRAVAALFVVLCHSYFEPANGYYANPVLSHLGLTYGHVAVDVFIVVSGFCLMLPIARHGNLMGSILSFYKRRGRRILPPYYAAVAFSILLILTFGGQLTGTVWDNSLPITWSAVLTHILLLHDFPIGDGGSLNYPLWSIAVEFQIYLLMPVLVYLFCRLGDVGTVVLCSAIGLLLHVLQPSALDGAAPWFVGLFAMGAVAARRGVAGAPQRSKLYRRVLYVVAAGVAGTIVLGGHTFFEKNMAYIDTGVGLLTAFTLYLTYTDPAPANIWLTRALSWGPLVRVGAFSYSLYLVHAPLVHVLDRAYAAILAPRPEVMFVLLLVSLPLIVGCAYVFHRVFERPFMSSESTTKQPRRAPLAAEATAV